MIAKTPSPPTMQGIFSNLGTEIEAGYVKTAEEMFA